MGEKVVVKPGTEGSAIGVFIVEARKPSKMLCRRRSISMTRRLSSVISRAVNSLSLFWGTMSRRLCPLSKSFPKSDFYDFESKYAVGGSQHICPARIPDDVTKVMQREAENAHKALSCSGTSRTDFILEDNGDCWALETNTIPGMTATSLLPDASSRRRHDLPELCTKLIELALEEPVR